MIFAAAAFTLYLRTRQTYSLRGLRRHKRAPFTLVLSSAVVYPGMFYLTKYLSVAFG